MADLENTSAGHRIEDTAAGAECSCGNEWSFWRPRGANVHGTRYMGSTVALLRANARRHAVAANNKEARRG